ncbi:MAG: tetratricopeptide repeat protein [Terriglobales bacterium]
MNRFGGLALATILLFPLAVMADEKGHDDGAPPEQLGEVSFPTSCTPAAQKNFVRGVALLHSFWYGEAGKAFESAATEEPGCAMAYWGVAMSLWHPLWEPPDEQSLADAWAAIQKAEAAGTKTPRERDYVGAIKTYYQDYKTREPAARAAAYEKAMAGVAQRYPEDREAAIFHALALIATASPTDSNHTHRKAAGAQLEKLFAEMPNHPGLAHYIIHTYDNPALAGRGLEAARRYAKIAPSASHALHMPSHIFTRLGLWQESLESNLAAAQAASEAMARGQQGRANQLHALDYAEYAALQSGRDAEAARLAEEIRQITATALEKSQGEEAYDIAFGHALTLSRYAIELRNWKDAAALPVIGQHSVPSLLAHATRAIGSARSGDVKQARAEIAQMEVIVEKLRGDRYAYGERPGTVELDQARAWLAQAEGKKKDALKLMRSVVEDVEAGKRNAQSYPPVVPAREMLADLMIEQGKAAEALKEYERALAHSPKRFNALYGAAHAAELAGQKAQASAYYAQLLRVTGGGANSSRPELARAKSEASGGK